MMSFESIDELLLVLSDPSRPDWGEAFGYLSTHPQTAGLVMEVFQETLSQLGVQPSGRDETTGEAQYSLADVARALGVPEDALVASAGET
jgi:hypothetical protein